MQFAQQGSQGVTLAQQALASGHPFALAFIDMRMPPGWDGLETIEHLWKADPDVQVVVCSAHSDYDWADFLERLGHSDKLLVLKKPFEPIEVLQCASALTRKWHDQQVVRRQLQSLEHMVAVRTMGLEVANDQLRHLATHDALTGLPNRVLLDDRLDQAIVHAERNRQQFAVLVLDLDRFKFINDSLGHHAGDELLNGVATRLRGVVSEIDTVARIGGDEFVLVLGPTAEKPDAVGVAQRVIEALQAPVKIAGVALHISTSVGIAFYPDDAHRAGKAHRARRCRDVLRQATRPQQPAMLRARHGYDHARPRQARERSARRACAAAVRAATTSPRSIPPPTTSAAPKHSSAGVIPERGVIMPDDFIPLAEDCGLISAIGEWVLREACRQCKAWQREGLPPMRVAVNVSATQFRQGNLLDIIRQAVNDVGPRPALPRAGAHRKRRDDQSGGVGASSPGAQRDGRARVGRRLRHGLLEHELPAPLSRSTSSRSIAVSSRT